MPKMICQEHHWLPMKPMTQSAWQEAMKTAITIVPEVRRLLAEYRAKGDKAYKEKADEKKRTLPGACFQAADVDVSIGTKRYNHGKRGKWREMKHMWLNGLAVIDLDHIADPRKLFEGLMAQFDLKAEGILLAYISASGEGLKIVFRARPEWGNLIDNQYEMAGRLGILDKVDDSCKDSSRLSFITTPDDVLYADTDALFAEPDPAAPRSDYDLRFGDRYRQSPKGDSSPTKPKWKALDEERKRKRKQSAPVSAAASPAGELPDTAAAAAPASAPPASASASPAGELPDTGAASVPASVSPASASASPAGELPDTGAAAAQPELTERQQAIVKALNAYYGPALPEGSRHATLCQQTSHWLLWLSDNDSRIAIAMARQLDWIRQWQPQPREVEDLIESAAVKKMLRSCPRALKELLEQAGIDTELPSGQGGQAEPQLPIDEWIEAIRGLFGTYPTLQEICEPHPTRLWPFLFFAAGALYTTLMTRCFYRLYDENPRRLNTNTLGVGDPASGKGALVRISDLICEPIVQADRLAVEALNNWKDEQRSKGANKDKAPRPKGCIRMHGARTSNQVFINDMVNAWEEVDGQRWQLHMLTVDTEALNSIKLQKVGGWIDKQVMEIKAWSNEVDSQQYANLDAVSGFFKIYWNQVRTCTPPALKLLANDANFGTGYPTRLSVVPVPGSDFQMIELRRQHEADQRADEAIRGWAYRLDRRYGELPFDALVEHAWHWTADRMEIAKFNDDRADELLLKRCAANAIAIAAPWIDMRHTGEREETGGYHTDGTDAQLLDMVLDIQYRTQHYYFGALAQNYFKEQYEEATTFRRRTTRYQQCFLALPEEFTTEQFCAIFGYANSHSANKTLNRLLNDKAISRTQRGMYKKRVHSIT